MTIRLSPFLLALLVALVVPPAHLIPNPWPRCSPGYCERLDNNQCISCSDPKAKQICNQADCRPRRSLKDVPEVVQSDSEYTDLLNKCGSVPYNAFLYVDSHLFATAVPIKTQNCPTLVVHAFFENEKEGRKEMRMFQNADEYHSMFPAEHSVFMGTFDLAQLTDAYENTHVDPDSEYSVLNNNCGSFLIQLASWLNVRIDAKVTSFVARRLWEESSKAWIDTIRDTLSNMVGSRRNLRMEASDEQIVELLVDSQASPLY